jgi:hypothetical protein
MDDCGFGDDFGSLVDEIELSGVAAFTFPGTSHNIGAVTSLRHTTHTLTGTGDENVLTFNVLTF